MSARDIHPLPMPWVEEIFKRLYGRFGKRFLDNFRSGAEVNGEDSGVTAAKAAWAIELADMDAEAIKRGLAHRYQYPPGCDEFAEACRPTLDAEGMFYRAVAEMERRRAGQPQDWPTPGLYWAAASMGGDLLTSRHKDVAARWRAALDAHGHRTDPIPATPVAQLPPPAPLTAEQAAQRLQELGVAGAKLAKADNQKRGFRSDWIDRIAANPQAVPASACRIAAQACAGMGKRVPDSLVGFLDKGAA